MNHQELKKFISQERVWLTDIRMELNKLLDGYLKRLDTMELRAAKEEEASPIKLEEEEND